MVSSLGNQQAQTLVDRIHTRVQALRQTQDPHQSSGALQTEEYTGVGYQKERLTYDGSVFCYTSYSPTESLACTFDGETSQCNQTLRREWFPHLGDTVREFSFNHRTGTLTAF